MPPVVCFVAYLRKHFDAFVVFRLIRLWRWNFFISVCTFFFVKHSFALLLW
eukprot:m.5956 g.5956  ORF g.5956 m.5956 type:complete len:51 (+) comp4528_c0_seq1:269-421(+)